MPAAGPPRTLKLTIAYEGTEYVGWQRQAAGISIQQRLEEALTRIEGSAVTVLGAGRTDAGVHALAQVASARVTLAHDATTLVRALNAALPADIRITSVADAPVDFHARFQARTKSYRYLIRTGSIVTPFERRYVWHLAPLLDVDAMHAAAGILLGEHDFSAFQSAGSDVGHAVRTLTASEVSSIGPRIDPRASTRPVEVPWDPLQTVAAGAPVGPLVVYDVTGTGFVRHMVRSIVGTLAEIGLGRRPVAWMGEVLAGGRRDDAGQTAPAQGLFLVGVDYGHAEASGQAATLAAGR